jgi:hypothetical protein
MIQHYETTNAPRDSQKRRKMRQKTENEPKSIGRRNKTMKTSIQTKGEAAAML